ncbi:hypothetical protein RQP46_007947 [Phenoliferia psychrophenolica]
MPSLSKIIIVVLLAVCTGRVAAAPVAVPAGDGIQQLQALERRIECAGGACTKPTRRFARTAAVSEATSAAKS